MLLYMDDRFAEHQTGRHPECPERILRINAHLRASDLIQSCVLRNWHPAQIEQVTRIHDPEYVERIRKIVDDGGGHVEADTIASRKTLDVAMLAAGAAVDAVQAVLEGDDNRAACLIRPPGHHALHDAPMGFCFLNNVAIAAHHAIIAYGLDRILIVDFDVHHGNGTQDIFWTSPVVHFYSMHRWPFYPGSGLKEEIGTDAGWARHTTNRIESGPPADEIVDAFESSVAHLSPRPPTTDSDQSCRLRRAPA
ncbi:MAG: histone deacetylase [Pirellulaceae bacterium]